MARYQPETIRALLETQGLALDEARVEAIAEVISRLSDVARGAAKQLTIDGEPAAFRVVLERHGDTP